MADPKTADRLLKHAAAGTRVNVIKVASAGHGFRGYQQDLAEAIYSWLYKQLKH